MKDQALNEGLANRTKRLLLWDVGKFFSGMRSQIPLLGSGSEPRNRRTRWRVAAWWSNESQIMVQKSLLRLLLFAHQNRLELPRVVRNFANEHRGLRRLRLLILARRLGRGLPLVEAVEQTPGILDEQNVLALRFASQLGVFTDSFCDRLQAIDRDRANAVAGLRRVSMYAMAMLLVLACYLIFTGSLLSPHMIGLANEYGLRSSWVDFNNVMLGNWGWCLILATSLIGFWIGILFLSSDARRFLRKRLRRMSHRLGLTSHTAELLSLLSHAAEQGRPISGSLSTLARYHYDRLIRLQLLFIRNEVEQGAEVWNCFKDAKLITAEEAEAIRECPDSRSQGWLLRQLSETRTAGVTARYRTLAALAHPLVTIMFAVTIGSICLANFYFLSDLLYAAQR